MALVVLTLGLWITAGSSQAQRQPPPNPNNDAAALQQ